MFKNLTAIFFVTNFLFLKVGFTQHMVRFKPTKEIICFADHSNKGTKILPPKLDELKGRTQSNATFEVEYIGFTSEAQTAFQAAVDIWAGLISSPVPIKIQARWESLESGVLGSAIWGDLIGNFVEAQELNTLYPIALAEKMTGRNLNGHDPDIIARFSSNAPWYLGTDQNPDANQFDLVSVVLHEIGHGLGFTDSFNFDEGVGFYGFQTVAGPIFPMIYDRYVENSPGQVLINEFPNSDDDLGTQLTSDDLFFNSPVATNDNMSRPRIFAPDPWNGGSSIAHLNESTYTSGNPNSLMTPQIGRNEVMQNPGPIALNMLGDMGWEFLYIRPDRPNSEDPTATEYPVIALIEGDNAVAEGTVQLHYSTDQFATETVVDMEPTANLNEYSADIPSTGVPTTYFYYVSADDEKGRTFNYPGVAPEFPAAFVTINADNTAPIISHIQPAFVRDTDLQLVLDATVVDFLPLSEVRVDYSIDGGSIESVNMTLIDNIDSIYQAVIDLSSTSLEQDDQITYSITAIDASINSNTSTENFEVGVVSLLPTVSVYTNDFNSATNDFISGGQFTIATPEGFTDGAIHSEHPYADGTGPGDESNYTIELRVPILLAESDALITFDEIVLVEPGENGTVFGDDQFWDYVVVEGSSDGGTTWIPFADGYDARDDSDWLELYNSNIEDQNSIAIGNPELFRPRVIDMLENGAFQSSEEVLIRFRLFADQAVHGWGWAIDNLSIQIDNTPPEILHDHLDLAFEESLEFTAQISDNRLVDSVAIALRVNNEDQPNQVFDIVTPEQQVNTNFELDISGIDRGDTIKYRYVAFDPDGNAAYLPGPDTFFEVLKVGVTAAVSSYSNNFNNPTQDFFGNFYSIAQPNGFNSPAIHTAHPYPLSFGLDNDSDFTFTLLQRIEITPSNPRLSFDEVVLVQPSSGGSFGSPSFNDFVIVEGSSDGGTTWIPFEDGYDSESANQPDWLTTFNNMGDGSETLASNHIINMTQSGDFGEGDEVYVRFRLNSDLAVNGWGWSIDNLEIQTDDILTALEGFDDISSVNVYPNPVTSDQLFIQFNPESNFEKCDIDLIDLSGRLHLTNQSTSVMDNQVVLDMTGFNPGVYLVKIKTDGGSNTKRIIKY